MRLLLDTQILLWRLYLPTRLSPAARGLLNGDVTLLVSLATVWEVAIRRGKGRLPFVPAHFLLDLEHGAYELLPITAAHAWRVGDFSGRHRDPFDRLLAAQALEEGVRMITSDREMAGYGVDVIPA